MSSKPPAPDAVEGDRFGASVFAPALPAYGVGSALRVNDGAPRARVSGRQHGARADSIVTGRHGERRCMRERKGRVEGPTSEDTAPIAYVTRTRKAYADRAYRVRAATSARGTSSWSIPNHGRCVRVAANRERQRRHVRRPDSTGTTSGMCRKRSPESCGPACTQLGDRSSC